MFGRSRGILDYTVRPTQEGAEILAEQALGRVQTVEGVDYLDGYRLPPDNKEVWNPVTYTVYTTYLSRAPYQTVTEQQSTLTNQFIRNANIHSIAQGMRPLFVKWEDVQLDPPEELPVFGVVNRAKRLFHKLVEKAAA